VFYMINKNMKKLYLILFFLLLAMVCVYLSGCSYDGIVDPIVSDDPVPPYSVPTVSPKNSQMPSPTQEITEPPILLTPGDNAASATSTPIPTPTPGTDNTTLTLSHNPGFYTQAFSLKFNYDNSYKVFYTTNGEEPTTKSSKYTSDGVKLSATTATTGSSDNINVIKVSLFTTSGEKIGDTITATYIINGSYNSFTDRYASLAVISISCDNDALYNPQTGIFYHDVNKGIYEQNYMQRGRKWERECHVEMFETGGDLAFSVDAGLRIFGGTSRGLPQKSLRLIARKEYDKDNGKFKHTIFPERKDTYGKVIDEYDSFILRSGGNDSLFGSSLRNTFFRDDLTGILAAGIDNVASMYSRTVAVYINGTYWGFYNLRDDTDTDFICEKYNVPADDIGIVTYGHENGNWFHDVDSGPESVLNDYHNMISTICSLDMTIDSNYNIACNILDIDNFIKYMLINMYINNRDWPQNNVRAWKYVGTNSQEGTYSDGKWRFIVKDTDYAWGIYELIGQTENVTATETAHNHTVVSGGGGELSALLASLLKNQSFRQAFVNMACDIANKYFSPETITPILDSFIKSIEQEYYFMATQTWYGSSISQADYNTWKSQNMQTLYTYANDRPQVFLEFIRTAIMRGESIIRLEIEVVNPEFGSVTVNSIKLPQSTTYYRSKYFKTNGIPLIIEAMPGYGYTVELINGHGTFENNEVFVKNSIGVKVIITFSQLPLDN